MEKKARDSSTNDSANGQTPSTSAQQHSTHSNNTRFAVLTPVCTRLRRWLESRHTKPQACTTTVNSRLPPWPLFLHGPLSQAKEQKENVCLNSKGFEPLPLS